MTEFYPLGKAMEWDSRLICLHSYLGSEDNQLLCAFIFPWLN